MTPADESEIEELKHYCSAVSAASEAGCTFYLLEGLKLPPSCKPACVDALLCPTQRDGYPSRLYFAERVATPVVRNWNGQVRVLERNWYAFSWRVNTPNLRPAQMVSHHLRAFVRP